MENKKIFLIGITLVVLSALVFQLGIAPSHPPTTTIPPSTFPERGIIKEFQEEIASGVVKPGECLTVVKEDKERFVSSDPNRRGWVRITEIIKDINICRDVEGNIERHYHAHVIQCDKSPDLTVVQCTHRHATE